MDRHPRLGRGGPRPRVPAVAGLLMAPRPPSRRDAAGQALLVAAWTLRWSLPLAALGAAVLVVAPPALALWFGADAYAARRRDTERAWRAHLEDMGA
jgi:hypothetical protein